MNNGCTNTALWLEDDFAFIQWTNMSWTAIFLKNASAYERSTVSLRWWDLT